MFKFIIPLIIFNFTSCSPLSDRTGTNTLIKELSNKSHNKKAILFLKEAGASVSDSYQVTITDINHILDNNEVGNTFTVDTDHDNTHLDKTSIKLTWLSGSILQIDYDKRLRAFIQEKSISGVSIIYKSR
jgi:hypothetical protein